MRVTTRPENAHQARLLELLRDGGPPIARRVGRLGTHVAVQGRRRVGPPHRPGADPERGARGVARRRRSGIVCLSPSLRFVGIDIGATSIAVAVTDGELQRPGESCRNPATCGRAPTRYSVLPSPWWPSCAIKACCRRSTASGWACRGR
ncbi:hypothetical protein ACU686_13655 [Yinghuangia aomiensis]